MIWLDKLADFIKVHLHIDIQKLININIHITNNSNGFTELDQKGYFFDKEKETLNLIPDKFPELQKELPKITQGYIGENNKLLELKSYNLLEKLYKYNELATNKGILSFFESIIPNEDYLALESSLFLRKQFLDGEPINELKKGIRNRLGDRGNNIANLCTAGYFEEFLIPLYNSSQEKFKKIYEDVIGKSILAIFVNRYTNPEEIPTQISRKLDLSKKYGIDFIHIHGISKTNIIKIKECIENNRDYFKFFDKKVFENDEKNIIVIELLLK